MPSLTDADQTASGDSAGDRLDRPLSTYLTLVTHSGGVFDRVSQLALSSVDGVIVGRGPYGLQRESSAARRWHWTLDETQVSKRHARLSFDGVCWRLEDLGSKNGVFLNGRRVGRIGLRDGDLFRIGGAFFLYSDHPVPARRDALDLTTSGDLDAFATLCPPLAEQFAQASELAPTRLSVLIGGHTGTGKELVAREIHRRSKRGGQFVGVNCGAIPESLFESELFGHKKGAFSGATEDRIGLVRAANGGTLFLDEIGELGEGSQVALLRVLQEREVRPVGSTRAVRIDVRVIAATHRDLGKSVDAGTFRQDLYARLLGHQIRLPPLAHRREDLGIIIHRLLRRHRDAPLEGPCFSNTAMQLLLEYGYPLNIRELEQTLERAMALAKNERIRARHLPEAFLPERSTPPADPDETSLEKRLRRALEETGGNISATARAFGKAPIQIRRWCKRFGIDYRRYR